MYPAYTSSSAAPKYILLRFAPDFTCKGLRNGRAWLPKNEKKKGLRDEVPAPESLLRDLEVPPAKPRLPGLLPSCTPLPREPGEPTAAREVKPWAEFSSCWSSSVDYVAQEIQAWGNALC